MSPLVEQIVQRLELLPEKVLQQVLEIVNLLAVSTSKVRSKAETQHQHEPNVNGSNLKKVGNAWIVKSSEQTYPYWDTDVLTVREERIEKFTQW
ncbi:MAG: hypothetical protein AAFW84_24060 [Cyanobacteria bacterium J06635_15]